MRRPHLLAAAFGVIGLLCASRLAAADPIGIDDDCATCQGSVFWLLYDPTPIGTTNGSTLYEITLRVDTTGYTGDGVRIGDVALKVSSTLDGVSLLDAPGGAASWEDGLGGISANGCMSNGNNGFACASSDDETAAALPNAGIYEWVFALAVPSDKSLFTAEFQGSVKARYLDALGEKTGDLVSENITLQVIPEPTTAVMVATGVAILARRRRV